MEKKVLLSDLPEGTKYQKAIVSEKGQTGIEYVDKYAYIQKVKIPKPKSLVGGSAVYKNDDVPYWYCKIKGGRDTFMHVYMEDLTKDNLLYDLKTGKKREFITCRQKKFERDVLEALENKPKEGFRWIPAYEPSLEPNGSVQFIGGEKPLDGLSCQQWYDIVKDYSPENESNISSKTTYFFLALRWLNDGVATLEQLADHSEEIGHYADSKNAQNDFENTGERKFGGIYGFVGNTSQIVEDSDSKSGYSVMGGSFYLNGNVCPLSLLTILIASSTIVVVCPSSENSIDYCYKLQRGELLNYVLPFLIL